MIITFEMLTNNYLLWNFTIHFLNTHLPLQLAKFSPLVVVR